jgi:homoserine dehydrogenase
VPLDEIETATYVRMAVRDQPGVLGAIATILGQEGVSIQSVVQRNADDEVAEIVWIMHPGEEKKLRSALDAIGRLAIVERVRSVIRVMQP